MTCTAMAARDVPGRVRRSSLHRVDARARILAFSFSLVVAITAVGSSPSVLAGLCAWPVAAIIVARVPMRAILLRLSFIAAFIGISGVFTFLFPLVSNPSPQRFWFLLFGSLFAVMSAAALAFSTSATEAMEALQRLRVPHHVMWTGFLGLRYLPLVYGEGRRVVRAASARGWRQKGLTPLAWMSASLVSRGFDRALRTGEAMEARGFGSDRIVFEPRPLKARDWAVALGYPGLLLAARLLLDGVGA